MWQVAQSNSAMLTVVDGPGSACLQKKDWEMMPLTLYKMQKFIGSGRYGVWPFPRRCMYPLLSFFCHFLFLRQRFRLSSPVSPATW